MLRTLRKESVAPSSGTEYMDLGGHSEKSGRAPAGFIRRNFFFLSRRVSQVLILLLFVAGYAYGLNILKGNLSSARLFGKVPLTDPFALLQIFATGAPASAEALIGALVVAVFYGVVGGRSFCGWVCPLNIVTDAANWIRSRLSIDAVGRIWVIPRKTRYWVTGLGLALSALLGVAAFEWISPVSMLHRGIIFGMGFGWTAVLMVFLFDLFVVKNGFCGHICPLGGIYSIIGRFSVLRVRHDKEKCSLCMKCLEVCPERQVLGMIGKESAMVLSGECTNCGRCIDVCGDRAMGFKNRLFKKQ